MQFLSTLSSRRATAKITQICGRSCYFYPRSPRGERRPRLRPTLKTPRFLSTLSSRRATPEGSPGYIRPLISIHALLAESDAGPGLLLPGLFYFYPRSPRGERRNGAVSLTYGNAISIHALLAESDVRNQCSETPNSHFYPRSPRGERPGTPFRSKTSFLFLSTLSSRRATNLTIDDDGHYVISIHALLAESDSKMLQKIGSFCSQTCYTTITIRDF